MADLEGSSSISDFTVSNKGEETLIITDVRRKSTKIHPNETHTFDAAGAYLGYIDHKRVFEIVFGEGNLIVNRARGEKSVDFGKILITATLI